MTPATYTGRMIRVCMECGDSYGALPCPPHQDGLESHGLCPVCAPAVMERYKREAELIDLSSSNFNANARPAPGGR